MENENKNSGQTLSFMINGKKFDWSEQYITGADLKKLADISYEDELFLKIKEPWKDELIANDTRVDLARPGIEHFFSKEKPVKIALIVNGREKQWEQETISFEQVVALAFGNYVENSNTSFTVTYKNGPERNPQGSMVKGDIVFVKNKMIFNVTATDKS